MSVQSDFLGIKELKQLSPRRRGELHQALEDLLSGDASLQAQALDCLVKMDAHRRSPLAIAILGNRVTERNRSIRAKIISMLAEPLRVNERSERAASNVLRILHDILSKLGKQEVYALTELVDDDASMLDPVCILLDQCSASGQILVDMVTQHDLKLSLRIAAADVIAQVGFLEAERPMKMFERRLLDRSARQLAMDFASQTREEAEKLVPVLRRTLQALEEAAF
jgi:hypothetical protein